MDAGAGTLAAAGIKKLYFPMALAKHHCTQLTYRIV
jgi:hypothetical protein